MRLSISLLGSFQAIVGQKSLLVSRTKKTEALLAYLVMEADRSHPRPSLDGLLFPEMSDKTARTNLRQIITRLRRAISDADASPPFLLATPETLQFNPASNYELDVLQFERGLQGCVQHFGRRVDHCPACMQRLKETVALYRGPFLAEFFVEDSEAFETWVQTRRAQLQRAALTALQSLADYYDRRGEYEVAEDYARRQVELEPWREEAHQQLMRLLARRGQRSAALAQYQLCCRLLAEELGVEPAPETAELYKRIQASADIRPHNLPAPGTQSFVGRQNELGYVRECLADPKRRLLTLVGSGGIGKTQLALRIGWAVATDYLGPFMDGVYFVPLVTKEVDNSTTAVAPLVMALAKAMTLSLAGQKPPEERLLAALQTKECLLLLDNGEYLGEADRAFIVDILQHTPGVQILVTSREQLDLADGWVLEVGGLAYPDLEPQQRQLDHPSAFGTNLETYEAIQLFVQRVCQVEAGFSLNQVSASERVAVAQISQLTQGMPLAIELAAPWVRVLSCQQLAQEINRNLNILATTTYNFPARHRSIRAVFDHSWERLSPVGRSFLAKLSVFQGSFSYEAAQQVTGIDLAVLLELIDKSLLQGVKEQAETRYELHPLLRQFCAEKLEGEALQQTQNRYSQYYGQFLQQRRDDLNGPRLPETLQAIQTDLENIRAGWHQAVSCRAFDLIGQYMDSLYDFYSFRGWWHEGRALFTQAIESIGEADSADEALMLLIAGLLSRLGEFHYALGSLNQAERYLQESLRLAHQIEEPHELAFTYKKLGLIAYVRGRYQEATKFLEFSLQIIDETNNEAQRAHTLMALGAVARTQEAYSQAQEFFQQSLSLYQTLDHQWGQGHAHRLLAGMIYKLGDAQQAKRHYQQSLEFCQMIDNQVGIALTWHGLGQIAQAEGDYDQARNLYDQALSLFQAADDKKGVAMVLESLGTLLADLGPDPMALDHLQTGFKVAVQIEDVPVGLKIALSIARLFGHRAPLHKADQARLIRLLQALHQHSASPPGTRTETLELLTALMGSSPLIPVFEEDVSLAELEQLVVSLIRVDG